MGVGQIEFGTHVHQRLRRGRDVIPDGEKTRPQYLGSVIALAASDPESHDEKPLTCDGRD